MIYYATHKMISSSSASNMKSSNSSFTGRASARAKVIVNSSAAGSPSARSKGFIVVSSATGEPQGAAPPDLAAASPDLAVASGSNGSVYFLLQIGQEFMPNLRDISHKFTESDKEAAHTFEASSEGKRFSDAFNDNQELLWMIYDFLLTDCSIPEYPACVFIESVVQILANEDTLVDSPMNTTHVFAACVFLVLQLVSKNDNADFWYKCVCDNFLPFATVFKKLLDNGVSVQYAIVIISGYHNHTVNWLCDTTTGMKSTMIPFHKSEVKSTLQEIIVNYLNDHKHDYNLLFSEWMSFIVDQNFDTKGLPEDQVANSSAGFVAFQKWLGENNDDDSSKLNFQVILATIVDEPLSKEALELYTNGFFGLHRLTDVSAAFRDLSPDSLDLFKRLLNTACEQSSVLDTHQSRGLLNILQPGKETIVDDNVFKCIHQALFELLLAVIKFARKKQIESRPRVVHQKHSTCDEKCMNSDSGGCNIRKVAAGVNTILGNFAVEVRKIFTDQHSKASHVPSKKVVSSGASPSGVNRQRQRNGAAGKASPHKQPKFQLTVSYATQPKQPPPKQPENSIRRTVSSAAPSSAAPTPIVISVCSTSDIGQIASRSSSDPVASQKLRNYFDKVHDHSPAPRQPGMSKEKWKINTERDARDRAAQAAAKAAQAAASAQEKPSLAQVSDNNDWDDDEWLIHDTETTGDKLVERHDEAHEMKTCDGLTAAARSYCAPHYPEPVQRQPTVLNIMPGYGSARTNQQPPACRSADNSQSAAVSSVQQKRVQPGYGSAPTNQPAAAPTVLNIMPGYGQNPAAMTPAQRSADRILSSDVRV